MDNTHLMGKNINKLEWPNVVVFTTPTPRKYMGRYYELIKYNLKNLHKYLWRLNNNIIYNNIIFYNIKLHKYIYYL